MIGEPQRALYGNKYGLTLPVFVHYGVQLWVPEVGGVVDPEAHDLVMSVFDGMSERERTRIKIRVRSAMTAQAPVEGRLLGAWWTRRSIMAATSSPKTSPQRAR